MSRTVKAGPRGVRLAATSALVASLCWACATTGAVPRPFPSPAGSAPPAAPPAPSNPAPPDPGAPAPAPAPANSIPSARRPSAPDAYAITGTALSLRGSPYRNGGADPSGFDCSGFTQYVFAQHGIHLPRDVREQFHSGKPVKSDDLAPGDLVFFATTNASASHVAIVVGGDEFVHAPSASGVVRVEHMSATYWSQRYLGARRVN